MKTNTRRPTVQTLSKADLLSLRADFEAKLRSIDVAILLLDQLGTARDEAPQKRAAKPKTLAKRAAPEKGTLRRGRRKPRGQTQRELAEKAMERFSDGFTLPQVMAEMRKTAPVKGNSLAALFTEMKRKGELEVVRPGSGNKPSLLRRVSR